MNDAIEVMEQRWGMTMAAGALVLGWALTIWFVILAVVAVIALVTVSPASAPPEDPLTDPEQSEPQPPSEAG